MDLLLGICFTTYDGRKLIYCSGKKTNGNRSLGAADAANLGFLVKSELIHALVYVVRSAKTAVKCFGNGEANRAAVRALC